MRILHIFRAPFGGLFRHVCDLVKAQSGLGHQVGIVCDSSTGGKAAVQTLSQLEPHCELGIRRMQMGRLPGIGDAMTARRIGEHAARLSPDIMHGHGAKGGVYVRLATFGHHASAIYTPHGGSLHYNWSSPAGAIFLGAERMLMTRTDGLIFVCEYERATFDAKIGIGKTRNCVVHNGLWESEFEPVTLARDATDVQYIGELRRLKGVDVLISALERLAASGRRISATITGDGVDRAEFEAQAKTAGLSGSICFTGALAARKAFRLGRLMVVPSRAESFPYIILEAIAAHKPLIASKVGGIGEVLPPDALVPPGNAEKLATAITAALDDFSQQQNIANLRAASLKTSSNAAVMAENICRFYADCLASGKARKVA